MQKDTGSPGIVFIKTAKLHLPEGHFSIPDFAQSRWLKRDNLIRKLAGIPRGDMGAVPL